MNSPSSTFSARVGHSRHARAHLSPLSRRVTQEAFARRGVAGRLAAHVRHSLEANALNPPVGSATEFWWDAHLVDRLNTSLTRYRD